MPVKKGFDPEGFYQVRGSVLNEYHVPKNKVSLARIMSSLVFTEDDLEIAVTKVCRETDVPESEIESVKAKFLKSVTNELLNNEMGDYEAAEEEVTEAITEVVRTAFEAFQNRKRRRKQTQTAVPPTGTPA